MRSRRCTGTSGYTRGDANALTFTLPFVVAGLGLGCTFAPMTTVTMRRVDPRLAGAASGVLNTLRQLGGVIGSAIVGAILQNRLATELVSQAQAQSVDLPAQFRPLFVQGFAQAANGALEVGRGETGVNLPPNIPPEAAAQVRQVAHQVFGTAYLNAMRPALAVPIGFMIFGALLTTLIIRRKHFAQAVPQAEPAAV